MISVSSYVGSFILLVVCFKSVITAQEIVLSTTKYRGEMDDDTFLNSYDHDFDPMTDAFVPSDSILQALNNSHHSENESNRTDGSSLMNLLIGKISNRKSSSKTHLLDELFQLEANISSERLRYLQGQRMLQNMDLTTEPCDDFYQYACGNWGKGHPIPDDSAGLDTFEQLRENLNLVLRELLEKPVDLEVDTSQAVIKVKHVYQSCMNLGRIEERKSEPLLRLLDDFGGWPLLMSSPGSNSSNSSTTDWIDIVARLRLFNNNVLISMWIGPDEYNSDHHIIHVDQSDLTLPSRAYYLDTNVTGGILDAYAELVEWTAITLGAVDHETVSQDVADLLDFETALAMILIPAEERRRNLATAVKNKVSISDLNYQWTTEDAPWTKYFNKIFGMSLNESEPIIISYAGDYFDRLASLLNQTDERTIKNYLLWRFVRHRLNNLDQRFLDLKQTFYSVLYGRKRQPDRWKTCISYVNSNMGMAVGSLFVKNYFSSESKNDTTRMIAEVRDVFEEMLDAAKWLDYDTRSHAKEKMANMGLKIGYPDYIVDDDLLDSQYEGVEVNVDTYFENVLRMLQYLAQDELRLLNRTVDRTLWSTTPAVVNAYYNRARNQIMLPAGILLPPFYHASFPRALNYGGIGVVIGHEITHGYDDQGRQFDSRGNLNAWWSEETATNFETRAQCIIEQYGNYSTRLANVDIFVNGVNTQGENIADNGGVRQAFKAYEKWLNESPPETIADESLPGLDKMTNKQLFFLNFAQIWCGNLRPEVAMAKLKSDVHAPGRFRVIGSLSNLEEFSRVFACPKGSLMNSDRDRCVVW